jgi:DNA polymerase
MRILIDFETYSEVDIRKSGSWAYAEHPSTEILCMAYKIGEDSTQLWTPPMPFPDLLKFAIHEDIPFEAHNVQFERAIWTHKLQGKERAMYYGMPYPLSNTGPVPMPQMWFDTMAVCAYRALPTSLDKVGPVLQLATQKSKEGKALITKLCKPRKPTKANADVRLSWEDADARGLWKELYAYCIQDVEAEYALAKALGDLPPEEAAVWGLDQLINQRGVAVDMDTVMCARTLADDMNTRLTTELRAITGDPKMTGKTVQRLVEWLGKQGLVLGDLRKDTVEQALDLLVPGNQPPEVKKALELRQYLSINSVAKLDTVLNVVNRDGRMRGLLQYHGSGTGRWAGRHFQPQNLPRPSVTNKFAGGKQVLDMEQLAFDLRTMDYDTLGLTYGNAAAALTTSLRGMLVAGPGRKLWVSDFSAIEARVTMWLAGQDDMVAAFQQFDRGEGPDIYCVAATKMYDKPINKSDHPNERGMGKIQVLGCGYQMGWRKLKMQALRDAGVELPDATAESIVTSYRTDNPTVPRLWYGLQGAVEAAIKTGRPQEYRGIVYFTAVNKSGRWLICTLPNKRRLWYFMPRLAEEAGYNGQMRQTIKYQGRDNKRGGTWGEVTTYGGMLTENVVQAIARDLLVGAMQRVEHAGYPVILTSHDEVIAETAADFGGMDEYNALMAGPLPEWAAGLPVAAEGWTGTRYRK